MRPISYGFVKVAVPGTPVNIGNCAATILGTGTSTFNITLNVNDKLLIAVDGGDQQTVTLTAGAARTAAQVVSDINSGTTGLTAVATAGGKVILMSDTLGATSEIRLDAITHSAYSTLGFTVGADVFGSADQRCAKIHLVPLIGNSGVVYVGNSASFDKTGGTGQIDYILKPVTTPATLDRFIVESQSDVDVLHTKEYFIDADNANDGVIVTIWPV